MLGVRDFRVIPAEGGEARSPAWGPEETVRQLSLAKAREVAARVSPEDVVVAADTIVWIDGQILGKPGTPAQAREMLTRLSGREHAVFTGVTVRRGETVLTEHEETRVRFRPLSEREIGAYVATGEPMDKAGAYGAQGKASLFVEGITGDFFNVMGLPVCRLGRMLERLGVELL